MSRPAADYGQLVASTEQPGSPADQRFWSAADAVLGTGPGQVAVPGAAELDLVAGTVVDDVQGLEIGTAVRYVFARIEALQETGHVAQAARLADDQGRPLLSRAAGRIPAAMQATCLSIMAEALLLEGRIRDSGVATREAANYATSAGGVENLSRAHAAMSAVLAMNGEFHRAEETRRSDALAGPADGWMPWTDALSNISIGFRTGDKERVAAAAQDAVRHDPSILGAALSSLGSGMAAMLGSDYPAALTHLGVVRQGIAREAGPLVSDLAVEFEVGALLQTGRVGQARELVAGRESTVDHGICFSGLRACVCLQMDDPRGALRETEGCLIDCPTHSLRTLPAVQLSRAVALELLDRPTAADLEFSRAAHLVAALDGFRPMLGLPAQPLAVLLERLVDQQPGFGGSLRRKLPGGLSFPVAPSALTDVSQFTRREKVLADWIFTDLNSTQIARELFVSADTVRSQLKSLYRKLGVSSRAGAVDRLRPLGVFGDPRDADG